MKPRFGHLLQMGQTLQFFPLSAFLLVAFHHGKPAVQDWFMAFLCSGALALLQIGGALVWLRGRPLNRLILGVNLYLVSGGLAVLLSWMPLLRQFDALRESGVFLSLLGTGLVTTLFSPAGFVGVTGHGDPARVRRYSAVLLLLTLGGLAASFHFRGRFLLSAGVPLFVLGVAMRVFRRRLGVWPVWVDGPGAS